MPHLNGHKGVKIFKYAVLGLVLMFVGNLVGKAVASEDRVLNAAQSMHIFPGVFDSTALLVTPAGSGGDGIATLDMHGTVITVIVFKECAQLIMDIPQAGPQFLGCAKDVLVIDEED